MPREFKKSRELDRILDKLQRKDKKMYENLLNKMGEILNISDVEHYKNLKHELKDYKRVHIAHSVLIFKFDKQNNFIYFVDFDHHDKIYKKIF